MANSNVFELLPQDIDARRGLHAPDLERGVLVVMVSNPSMCGFCRLAEPDFHAAANLSRGLELVQFATVHLDRPEWARLDHASQRLLLDHVAPGSDKIPDYAYLVNGKVTGWKPIDRTARTIYDLAQQLANDLVNGAPAAAGPSRPHRGASWYIDDEDDEEDEEDRDLFDAYMAGLDLDSAYGFDDRDVYLAGGDRPSYADAQCQSYGFCA